MRPRQRRSACRATRSFRCRDSLDPAAEPAPRRWLARWRRIGHGGCLGGTVRRRAVDRSRLSQAAPIMRARRSMLLRCLPPQALPNRAQPGNLHDPPKPMRRSLSRLGVQRPRRLRLPGDDRRRQFLRRRRHLRVLPDRRRLRADRTARRRLRPFRGRSLLWRRCGNRLHPAMPDPGAISDRVDELRARNRLDRRANRGRRHGRIDVRCDGARLGQAIPPSRA
jgi:hypothetical protein